MLYLELAELPVRSSDAKMPINSSFFMMLAMNKGAMSLDECFSLPKTQQCYHDKRGVPDFRDQLATEISSTDLMDVIRVLGVFVPLRQQRMT